MGLTVIVSVAIEVVANLVSDNFPSIWTLTLAGLALSLISLVLWGKRLELRRIALAYGRPGRSSDSSLLPLTRATGWSARVDPDRPAVFRPSVLRSSILFGIAAAIWLACSLGTYASTDWILPVDSTPYERYDSPPVALVLVGVAVAVLLAFAVGWKLCGVRNLPPPEERDKAEWLGWVSGAIWALPGSLILVSSSVYGVQGYSDWQPVLAVAFGMVLVSFVVLLAASARLGYDFALSDSTMATRLRQRSAAIDMVPRMVSKLVRRILGQRPGDATRFLLDVLLTIPSARAFAVQNGVMAVAAGHRVALISVVSWPSGRYARRGSVGVMRNGQPSPAQDSAIPPVTAQLRTLKAAMPSRAILRAFIVVATSNPRGGPVELENGPGQILFVTHEEAAEVIGEFLAAQPYHIDLMIAIRLSQLDRHWYLS